MNTMINIVYLMPEEHDHTPIWYVDEEEYTKPSAMSADLDVSTALICFEGGFYGMLTTGLDLHHEIKGLPGLLEGKRNETTAVLKSYFGAPSSAMLLESLAVSGVDTVIMAGEAGSLSDRCRIGDVVIPTWGIREEGTSYHYFPPEHAVSPSGDLVDKIEGCFDSEVKKGGVWTIDAGLRETKSKIEEYSKRVVLAVDMECTALMAVEEYRNVEFAALLVITDELFTDEWQRGFRRREVREGKKKVVEAVGLCLHIGDRRLKDDK